MTSKSNLAFGIKRRRLGIFSFVTRSTLFWGSSVAIAIQVLLHSPRLALVCGGAIAFSQLLFQEIQTSVKSMNRWNVSLKLAFIAFLIIWLVLDQSAPAQAQFFKNAETWLSTNLTPTGSSTTGSSNYTDLIKLVFNVLRAMYLLYLGISLVRVVYSVRQDEDWQAVARTPLMILLTVTVADVLTTVIVGTATSTPT
jgi:hypothetical protein